MYVPNRWPKLPICLKRVLYERKAHLLWESKSKKYRVPSSAIEESAKSDVFETKTNHNFDLKMSFKSTFFMSLEFMHSFEQKCILHYIRLFENEKSGWYGALSKLETYKIFVKAQHKITDWWESKWKCLKNCNKDSKFFTADEMCHASLFCIGLWPAQKCTEFAYADWYNFLQFSHLIAFWVIDNLRNKPGKIESGSANN